MTKKIGIFVGSLRKDSFNKLVAKTMADLFQLISNLFLLTLVI